MNTRTELLSILLVLAANVAMARNDSSIVAKSIDLNELVVKGSNMHRQEDGSLLIYPNANQRKYAYNGYEVLKNLMLPGLRVDTESGSVSAMGMQATIYMNGVPCDTRDVAMMRPKDIEKIEYHDAPSGKYAKDNVAINFITKQYRYGGYVMATGKQTIGYTHGSYDASASINSGSTTYSVFAGADYSDISGSESSGTEVYSFPSEKIYRSSQRTTELRSHGEYAQLRLQNSSEKHYLVWKLALVNNATPRSNEDGMTDNNGEPSAFMSSTSRRNLMPQTSLSGRATLPSNQAFDYGLSAQYSHNGYDRIYEEGDFRSATYEKEDAGAFRTYAIYNKYQSKSSLSAEIYHHHHFWNARYTGDNALWQHLWKSESQAFVGYNGRFGQRLSLQSRLGVDWMQYRLHGSDKVWQVTPRIELTARYRLKEGMLMLSSFFANGTYGMDIINNARLQVTPYMTQTGNPELENPCVTNTYIYGMNKFGRLHVSAYLLHNYYHNLVINEYIVGADGPSMIKSYRNANATHNVTATLAATYSFTDKFQLTGLMKYHHTALSAASLSRHCNSITGDVELKWYLKNFALSAEVDLNDKALNSGTLTVIEAPVNYNMQLSYRYKNLYTSILLDSPFAKRRMRSFLDTPGYTSESCSYNRAGSQYCNMTVSYTFDFGRRTEKVNDEVDKSSSSSLMQI